MRHKNRRWLLVWASSFLLHVFRCEVTAADGVLNSTRTENSTSQKELRSVFSPRMDYEQWTPLGRGDPLKNDPTYDYVPPVLERVHYWMDPASRKPDPPLPGDQNQKTEILLLGVSSSKPSTPVAADSRRDTYDPFIKFVDGPKFSSTNYQRLSRPHYQMPYSYYPSPYYKNKATYSKNERVPYTMLMPPPIPNPVQQEKNTENPLYGEIPVTSESSITVQEGNLVYHSSTSGGLDDGDKHVDSSSVVTWRTPLPYNDYKFIRNQTFMKNNDTQKVLSFAMTLNSDDVQISGPDVMYKGQVSDGDLDLASTYVNIGKPEAQLHSAPTLIVEPPVLVQAMSKRPMTLQMQTMQPPPIPIPTRGNLLKPAPTNSGSLVSLLQKEVTPSLMSTMASFIANIPKMSTTTTPPPTTTTTINSLTTDPLFKHYKQPLEPLRGPMYLIIQGHSKVKTYGPAKQIHGINIQEINEIPISDYKDEFQVKHLHTYRKKVEDSPRTGRASNLKTLAEAVQNGFGAIDYADRRIDANDIQETDLETSFDVGANQENAELYHKGFVEVDKLSRELKGV